MINLAKTEYIAVSGPDAAGKKEPLKKPGWQRPSLRFLMPMPLVFKSRPW
jgi:hypothetical protein